MAITLHIVGLSSILLLTIGCVIAFKRKPTWKNAVTGLVVATVLGFAFICCTLILG